MANTIDIEKTDKAKKVKVKDIYPLLPLRDIVVFPYMSVPLLVGRPRSVKALDEAMACDKMIFLIAQKDLNIDEPAENELYRVGTLAEITQVMRLPDGSIKLIVEGRRRAGVIRFINEKQLAKAQIDIVCHTIEQKIEIEALSRSLRSQFEEYVSLNPKTSPDALDAVHAADGPDRLADTIAAGLTCKVAEKQAFLECFDTEKRMKELASLLNGEIEILKVEQRIMSNIRRQMEKAQKEYFLNEQLKAIEKELGVSDASRGELAEMREKVVKSGMSKEAEAVARKELERLSKMMPVSPEATVSRNYIDWLINLPWAKRTDDNLDIANAEKVLNDDHYGLEKPKQRILEYLAVRKLSDSLKGQILCFAGPPGVGKTSLARSIARALGRNFVRVSLGGIRDEAEIRGHRRTYIGALPGRVIQSMKKARSRNPVFLLDEIDKMSSDFRGDPASALLEVLDPEENRAFSDHYLEVGFDLSEVMFITTCNIEDNIPFPLLDRMEIIRLSGYTDYEKHHIAVSFLLPKQIKAHGLLAGNLTIRESALYKIIRQYTREAGVRGLERRLAEICRKTAREAVNKGKDVKVTVTVKSTERFLGPPEFSEASKKRPDEVGVATGLAWTETGGEVIDIETSVMKGKGELILTGKLGEVMQESAKASLTYMRVHMERHRKKIDSTKDMDIHIHIPEGAIPKDGPSAGITIATALISKFTNRPVRRDIAMTGEITLRGKILPVGGVKSKILAAHRAGISTVLLPKDNLKDLHDIPKAVLRRMKVIPVETMEDVVKQVLTNSP